LHLSLNLRLSGGKGRIFGRSGGAYSRGGGKGDEKLGIALTHEPGGIEGGGEKGNVRIQRAKKEETREKKRELCQ